MASSSQQPEWEGGGVLDKMAGDWTAEELQAVLYSTEVEEAIQEVFPSNDPLDSKDFDAIDYINTLFPTEQSLAGVDDTVSRLRVKMKVLDEDIRTIVREQAEAGHEGRQALEEAQKAIEELFGRIRNIKEKAEHSELMVQKITGDIKQLDIAKKHLMDSVRTLERLRLLITNLEEIDRNMRLRQYAQVASQLHGAGDVVEEFNKYQAIPQIKYLIDRLASMKRDLAAQIKVDFEKAFSIRGTAGGARAELHDACLVLDVLGEPPKEELIKWFVKMQLSDYDMLFHESLDPSWLDKVDRRYSWLKRTLLNYEEECSAIFPPEWSMPERICIEFCQKTKKGLSIVMKNKAADLEVKLLLFAIQKTTAFEKFLAQRFTGSPYMETLIPKKVLQAETTEDDHKSPGSYSKQDSSPFLGMISRCFEPHLNVYIESQDKNLSELMENFVSDVKSYLPSKGAAEGDMTTVAFPSAADLFIFYKRCLVQCTSLSTGPPLLELTTVFQKYLKEYTDKILGANLPKLNSGSRRTLTGLKRDTPQDVRLSRDEITMTCTILCTADYCLETTQQLESKLKEKIDESLVDKVDFNQEMDLFRSLTSTCIQLLIQDSETACVASFNAMTKIPWGTVEVVGDQSQYVSQVIGHLRSTIPLIRQNLAAVRKYFINFCHKFANVFIPAFITHLYKCKPINTIAAEQLLLDTHSLKSALLELPSVCATVTRKAPASFTKLVATGMEKAELIVKIVMSPHEQAQEFVSHYLSIMQGDNDPSNFQKILEMKGLRRNEQHVLLELFKVKVSSKQEGEKEDAPISAVGSGGDKGLLGMKKLEIVERLMRTRTTDSFKSNK